MTQRKLMDQNHSSAPADPAPTLPDQVNEWRDEMAAGGFLDAQQKTALDIAITEARAGRVDNPPPPLLTILLLGATGGGKSALLNALAGAEVARSHHLRPTTSQPTIYLHEAIAPARLFEYGPELGQLASSGGSIQVHTREDLRNKIIIDAPDIDSYRTEHRETVLRLLPIVDVALYVVTPFSYKDDIGWEMVQRERGRRAFAFVMNKWDNEGMPRVAEGEAGPDKDFARLVKERGGYDNAKLFLTSARSHTLEPSDPERPTPATGENFAELKQWLEQGLSTSRIEQIQRRRRRSLWGALAGALASAIPPDINADVLRREAAAEADQMVIEGKAAWALLIEHRAEALARRREEEGRPHSPGPFGRLSALFSAIINAGASFRKVTEPRPDVTLEELQAAATRSTELAARKLERIEWQLRSHKIPAGSLPEELNTITQDLGHRLTAEFQMQSERILGAIIQPWRIKAGWVVLVIFELLATGLFGLAAWRLILAFLSGDYLDLPFTLNLLSLLILLLASGSAIMAMLFPPVKVRLRRELTNVISQVWQNAADRTLVKTDDFLESIEQLRETGADLLNQCNSRVSQITREMNAADDSEAERLFVPSETHPGARASVPAFKVDI